MCSLDKKCAANMFRGSHRHFPWGGLISRWYSLIPESFKDNLGFYPTPSQKHVDLLVTIDTATVSCSVLVSAPF